jgi:hypothetical protein
LNHQAVFHSVIVSYFLESAAFALLCSLSVSRMKQRHISLAMALPGNSGAHAGIHSATKKNNRFALLGHVFPCFVN